MENNKKWQKKISQIRAKLNIHFDPHRKLQVPIHQTLFNLLQTEISKPERKVFHQESFYLTTTVNPLKS